MQIAKQDAECPFAVGESVRYMPSERGFALDVMLASSGRLEPGKTYKVSRIAESFYVEVEGYNHPAGGIYWTEFEPGN